MAKVTFDYSAAKNFISDAELDMMERIAEDAKKTLVSKTGAGNDFLDGLTFRLSMIRKSLHVFRRQQRRFRTIQKFF